MNRDELIRRVRALPFDAAHYWLVAGGAMVLHGLRAETRDVDLGCDSALADWLEERGCAVSGDRRDGRKIDCAEDVEIFENWLYDEIVLVEGIPVISLPGLRAMKLAIGRQKDLRDVALIDERLKK